MELLNTWRTVVKDFETNFEEVIPKWGRKLNGDDRSEQERRRSLSPICPTQRELGAHLPHSHTDLRAEHQARSGSQCTLPGWWTDWFIFSLHGTKKSKQNPGQTYKTFLKNTYCSCFHVLNLMPRHCLCTQFSAPATISASLIKFPTWKLDFFRIFLICPKALVSPLNLLLISLTW